jgi:hypothetical protein
MYRGEVKNKQKEGKPFTLHHCWAKLENDKWKNHEMHEVPKRSNKIGDATIVDGDDDDTSSDEGK